MDLKDVYHASVTLDKMRCDVMRDSDVPEAWVRIWTEQADRRLTEIFADRAKHNPRAIDLGDFVAFSNRINRGTKKYSDMRDHFAFGRVEEIHDGYAVLWSCDGHKDYHIPYNRIYVISDI